MVEATPRKSRQIQTSRQRGTAENAKGTRNFQEAGGQDHRSKEAVCPELSLGHCSPRRMGPKQGSRSLDRRSLSQGRVAFSWAGGVYDFEAYEDTGVEERVIEDDGKQEIFAEEAFQAKKQAALDTLHKQAKDREATSVKAKESDMTFTDLVQVVRSFGDRSSSSAAAAAETKTAEDEQVVEESSSSSTSSSSGDEAAVGLDLLSGAAPQKSNADHAEKPKAKPKPKAKDTAKTTKTASTAPKTGKASSQVTAAPSKSQGSSALAGESMGPGPGMLSLDGRASRTLKSLETAIEQAQESISKVNYDDQP